MTHTAHPYAQRVGVIRSWKSRWFSSTPSQYRENVKIDTTIREFLKKRVRGMHVTNIEIERGDKDVRVKIKTARPGLVIGRGGEGSTRLTKDLNALVRKMQLQETPVVRLDIEEVKSPESHAPVVAQMIVEGLEKRMPFRRVMKQTIEKVMANRDVKGVRISISGRLGGAEMSRREEIKKGRIPLQTLRADIDFSREVARLPYGVIGVKVWIYRGDIFDSAPSKTSSR